MKRKRAHACFDLYLCVCLSMLNVTIFGFFASHFTIFGQRNRTERMGEEKLSSTLRVILRQYGMVWYGSYLHNVYTRKKIVAWFHIHRHICLLLTKPNYRLISRPTIFLVHLYISYSQEPMNRVGLRGH